MKGSLSKKLESDSNKRVIMDIGAVLTKIKEKEEFVESERT